MEGGQRQFYSDNTHQALAPLLSDVGGGCLSSHLNVTHVEFLHPLPALLSRCRVAGDIKIAQAQRLATLQYTEQQKNTQR